MIRLHAPALPTHAVDFLKAQQDAIDALTDYAQRVQDGKDRWDAKMNTDGGKRALLAIREALATMSRGRRCHYCEDSWADEVEHFQPKDLYPEVAFVWENYLYACGPCNGSQKSNRWSVLDASGALIDVTRRRGAPVAPPQAGAGALINPRLEDPLAFLTLDLSTGYLIERVRDPSTVAHRRAGYTIKTLGLNRDPLPERRQDAYESKKSDLSRYADEKTRAARSPMSVVRAQQLLLKDHRLVWAEMKANAASDEELAVLFEVAPEALGW